LVQPSRTGDGCPELRSTPEDGLEVAHNLGRRKTR
jgi:hypothetical protein